MSCWFPVLRGSVVVVGDVVFAVAGFAAAATVVDASACVTPVRVPYR